MPINELSDKFKMIDSSVIHSIIYDAETLELSVRFVDGDNYGYNNVPERVYKDFINSSSKGKFFNKYIRSVYD